MKNTTYIIILIAFVSLSSCHSNSASSEGEMNNQPSRDTGGISITAAQFESSKMILETMSEHVFPKVVKTTGIIDVPPKNKEIVSSFYEGFIKKSDLLVGDFVKKGQALVTIENPEFIDMQQEYLEIKEQIGYLKSEYERQKTLYEERISSQKNYQKTASEYKRSLATLKGLKKKLELMNISINQVERGNLTSVITLYSSISGSISQINVNRGTHVDKADPIMEIINDEHIHVELSVFEKDAIKIRKGQKISFTIPEISDKNYPAEVHLVGKSIDKNSRTIVVHGHLLDDSKTHFDIGMFVDATIEIETTSSLALPEDAVVDQGGRKVVLRLKENTQGNLVFEAIDVTVGKSYAGFVQVESDKLSKTDKILVKGVFDLMN